MSANKALIIGAGLGTAYLAYTGFFNTNRTQQEQPATGAGGGSGATGDKQEPFSINFGASEPQSSFTDDTELSATSTSSKSSSFKKQRNTNRRLASKAGATGGYSFTDGEAFTRDGKVTGGTDLELGASLTPKGVRDKQSSNSSQLKKEKLSSNVNDFVSRETDFSERKR